MKKYHITIEWETYIGNPCTKCQVIVANNEREALNILADRVKQYKKCMKIQGGSAVEVK
jgi:hypothetical protein